MFQDSKEVVSLKVHAIEFAYRSLERFIAEKKIEVDLRLDKEKRQIHVGHDRYLSNPDGSFSGEETSYIGKLHRAARNLGLVQDVLKGSSPLNIKLFTSYCLKDRPYDFYPVLPETVPFK